MWGSSMKHNICAYYAYMLCFMESTNLQMIGPRFLEPDWKKFKSLSKVSLFSATLKVVHESTYAMASKYPQVQRVKLHFDVPHKIC